MCLFWCFVPLFFSLAKFERGFIKTNFIERNRMTTGWKKCDISPDYIQNYKIRDTHFNITY